MVREGWKMCENVQRAWSEWDWVDEKGVGGKERVRFFLPRKDFTPRFGPYISGKGVLDDTDVWPSQGALKSHRGCMWEWGLGMS